MIVGQSCILISLCISQNAAQFPPKTRVQAKEGSRVAHLLKFVAFPVLVWDSLVDNCRTQRQGLDSRSVSSERRHVGGADNCLIARKRYWRISTEGHKAGSATS